MEKHIKKQRFKETLSPNELTHLSTCRFCREELIRQVEEEEMLTAPRHLKSSVLEKSKRLDVQLVAGSNQLSKKLQLFFFSLKVSAAVLCVLTMLTVAPGISSGLEHGLQTGREEILIQKEADHRWNYYEKIESFTAKLFQLSNSKMEELKYDKEKR